MSYLTRIICFLSCMFISRSQLISLVGNNISVVVASFSISVWKWTFYPVKLGIWDFSCPSHQTFLSAYDMSKREKTRFESAHKEAVDFHSFFSCPGAGDSVRTDLMVDPRSKSLVLNGKPGHLQFYSLQRDKLLYNVSTL